MFKRKTEGSVLCTSCGVLVGVNDETCYNCGRRNPSLWGFAPALRALGGDLGFVPFVISACAIIYGLTLIYSGPEIRMSGVFGFLGPSNFSIVVFGASGAVPVFRFDRWWSVLSAGWLHAGLLLLKVLIPHGQHFVERLIPAEMFLDVVLWPRPKANGHNHTHRA